MPWKIFELGFYWSVSTIVFLCEKTFKNIYLIEVLHHKNCKCMCQKDCLYFWPQIEKLLSTMEKFFEIKICKFIQEWIQMNQYRLIQIDFSIIRQRLVIIHWDENKYFNWQLNFISLYSVDDGFTAKIFINSVFMQKSVCELRKKFRNLDSKIMQYVYKCS